MKGANPVQQRRRGRATAAAHTQSSSSSAEAQAAKEDGGDGYGQADDDDGDGGSEQADEEEEAASSAADGAAAVSALLLSCRESWLHALSLVRGVSEEKAAVISRQYPSARELMAAYARLAAGEAEALLAGLQCGKRRIGEQVSKRVYHTLYTAAPS